MEIKHNLKSPELQTINISTIDMAGERQASIFEQIGALTMSWASFEHSLTGLLIYHSGMPPRSGYIMIGRMSSKAKYDKIIKIMKANKESENVIEFLAKCKKLSIVPCDIRNTISHCAYAGASKTNSNLFYFAAKRLPEKTGTTLAFPITTKEITDVAKFAQNMAVMNSDIALKLLEAGKAKEH